MFAVQHWNDTGRGHYSSRTQINAGAKTEPLLESSPGPLLTSGMRPLNRYGTRQETINRRHEHMYSPSGNGLGRGHYSRLSGINAVGPTVATIQIISWAIFEIS